MFSKVAARQQLTAVSPDRGLFNFRYRSNRRPDVFRHCYNLQTLLQSKNQPKINLDGELLASCRDQASSPWPCLMLVARCWDIGNGVRGGGSAKDEIKAEINPARNEEKQLQTPVSVEQAGAGLDEKKQEEAPHAQAEAKIVPGLEAVTGNEQADNGDEQPNSADESTDEPQSMDVSPMSKDDGISIPEFSPLNEVSHVAELEKEQNEPGDAQAVEDLIDLTVHSTYTQLSCDKISLDDCNKNLIEGRCLSMENPLITSLTTSVEETHMQPSAEF
ncbi:MAP7 domain-containing protein 2-like [Chiloscyllium plagiosum]|uniref:MAP7 domain-containing protein 2-like n=1 Tax=Chiloscyllium plagiosum TaxID=36176 RepID=UPI001CB7B6F7|nr:MAP7 domain-containing protein 2-like [Chiloscyllium plagiosum]